MGVIRASFYSALFALAGSWSAFAQVPAVAVAAHPFSEASFACTPDESWIFGNEISKPLRARLKGAPADKDEAVNSFIVGYALKLVAKTAEGTTLGEYFMYRAFYELNLIHFADRGFGAILNTPPNPATQGIKIAALACMNEIHHKHPSLGIAYNTAWSLGPVTFGHLNGNQRDTIWQGMATVAGRKLFVAGRQAQIQGELALLQGSGAYAAFVKSIEAMTLQQDRPAMAFTEQFLKYQNLPEYLKSQEDGAHLNLARLYYHDQEYAKSSAEFKKVKQQSNFFSRAISDASWAEIMLKHYPEATGSAYNLMVGDLRKTFAPEAPTVIAMSLFENCHYKEAADTIGVFKKSYDKTYRWLYNWYHQQKIKPTPLYPLVVAFLKTGKGVPEPLASEWIRSPVFIAEQKELNLTFEEQQTARELVNAVARASKAESQKLRTTFKALLANFITKIPETQQKVIETINAELATRNNTMISTLVESFETAQLIEVEIYNQAGEDMLNKSPTKSLAKQPVPASHGTKDGPPALDWGRFPADDGEEESETWGDELGALKTDVTNICKKK